MEPRKPNRGKAVNITLITTIVPVGHLADLEKCLRAAGVHGMNVDDAHGEHDKTGRKT